MSKRKTTIEINGKLYDAVTGDLLKGSGPAVHKAAPHHAAPETHAAPKKPVLRGVVRHNAKPAAGHAPEAASTLMRSAVKKPSPAPPPHLKAQAPVNSLPEKSLPAVVVGKSAKRLDHGRLAKAQGVRRSRLISHFSATVTQPSQPMFEPPAIPDRPPSPPVRAKTIPASHHPKTTADLLDTALQAATSHRQRPVTAPKHRGGRRTAAGASLVATLLIIGIAGSRQLPAMRLQTASAKAGFSATLPAYHPAGYSLQKLEAGPGIVAGNFHSNSDNRVYSVTQRQSTWDNVGLRDNFVASIDADYQTFNQSGRTVYVYSDGNATWVNDGVWYIVQSHDSLSQRQLLDLAASL